MPTSPGGRRLHAGLGLKLVSWEVKVRGRASCGWACGQESQGPRLVTGDVVSLVGVSEPLDGRSSVQLVLRIFSSY